MRPWSHFASFQISPRHDPIATTPRYGRNLSPPSEEFLRGLTDILGDLPPHCSVSTVMRSLRFMPRSCSQRLRLPNFRWYRRHYAPSGHSRSAQTKVAWVAHVPDLWFTMKSPRAPLTALPLLCVTLAAVATLTAEPARDYPTRVATVTNTPGCVAFSDGSSFSPRTEFCGIRWRSFGRRNASAAGLGEASFDGFF